MGAEVSSFWPNNCLCAYCLSCNLPTVCHICRQPSLLQKTLAIKDAGNTAKSIELDKEILCGKELGKEIALYFHRSFHLEF